MRSSIGLLAASAAGAVAQSTLTTSLFMGGNVVDGVGYIGSVVSAGPSDTVYALACTATDICGPESITQTLTIGPSKFDYQFVTETMGVQGSASETCQISGTTAAVCKVSVEFDISIKDVATTSTAIVTTTTFTGSEMAGVPVELTAGVEKLSGATPASAAASSTASASKSSKASGSSTAASSSAAGSASAASSSSASGASSTMSSGRGGDILAFVMFSAVSVSVGALMIL
ncbi:hypothetical protein QM012_006729 [Aureobasidium pullulans]|uniref:GPI anchored cell wall protein n=1 Tax=Aureobasidium pullulans TaxID=5580 RepID=A0ABR0TPF7_AURPU